MCLFSPPQLRIFHRLSGSNKLNAAGVADYARDSTTRQLARIRT